MSDKERLEEIKQDVKMTRKDLAVSPSNEMTLHMDIMLNSMDYLIEQAERVQELEEIKSEAIKQIDVTQRRNERLQKRVWELEEELHFCKVTKLSMDSVEKYTSQLKQQNKRYRKALIIAREELTTILEVENLTSDQIRDCAENAYSKIYEALEESE